MAASVAPLCSVAPVADIDEVTGYCGGRGHGGADEVRAATLALPTLEVAVRCRGAAFAGLEDVGVHTQAHRAASLAPIKAGLLEDGVETLGFRLRLHLHRTGHDHRVDT